MRSTLLERIRRIPLGYGILGIITATVATVLVLGNTTSLLSLVASSASSLGSHEAVLFFMPEEGKMIAKDQTVRIDIRVNTKVPINAVGATLLYPPEQLEIIGISKEDSFLDLWTEETSIDEKDGEIRFSGGTLASGGHTGLGTVLSLSVRAKTVGRIELLFKDAEVFGHDGRGKTLESEARSFAYISKENNSNLGRAVQQTAQETVPRREAVTDFNDDGRTSLADLSILAVQLISTYNTHYDIDGDGSVNLKDLSILFTKMR